MPTWQSQKFRFQPFLQEITSFQSEIATPLRARDDILRTFLTNSAASYDAAVHFYLRISINRSIGMFNVLDRSSSRPTVGFETAVSTR